MNIKTEIMKATDLTKDDYYILSTNRSVIRRLKAMGLQHWGYDDSADVCVEVLDGYRYRAVNHDESLRRCPEITEAEFMSRSEDLIFPVDYKLQALQAVSAAITNRELLNDELRAVMDQVDNAIKKATK